MTAEHLQERLRPLRIIAVPSGRGAPDGRCGDGPEALRAAGLVEHLARLRPDAHWQATLECAEPGLSPFEAVSELCPRIADETSRAIDAGGLPLVFSGDHSCAIGIWAGISRAIRPQGALGLMWIDAHLDSHTPQTSHTGMIHGMPLAALLGHGEDALTGCGGEGAKLHAQNVCIVGARSFEPGEQRLLIELGVRVFYMDEIRRRGLAKVFADALEVVQAGTAGFGISFDIDAIDPLEAPGVGTPAARGIDAAGLQSVLRGIGSHPKLAGIEISEYNPARDKEGKTARIVMDVLEAMLATRDPASASV